MWCFQSGFQLPLLSFQLLFWHLTNSSHSQSVILGCFGVSASELHCGTFCRTGANTVLFLQLGSCIGWARWLSPVHQACRKEGEFPFPVDLLLVADWVTKPELTQWIRNPVPSLQFPGSLAAKGSKHQDFLQGDSPRAKCLHAGPPSLQRLVSMVPALAFKVASEIVSGCPSRQKSTAGVLQAHMATSPPLAGLEEDRALPGGPLCRLM